MIKSLTITIVISVLVSIVTFYTLAPTQETISIVDIPKSIEKAAVLLSKTKLSPHMQEKIMKQYSSNLDKTVKEYGEKNNTIIVAASVLVSGKKDITNEIVKMGIKKEVGHV
jgi:type-F conjugative transfer system protein TrbI